jgi:predicted glycogen debranching enzyme
MILPPSVNIAFDADLLRRADESLHREWLVTNGIGGYASATLATANTRRYHALLVAALTPPLGRAVLLSKLEETLIVTDAAGSATTYALSANVYPNAVYPQGYAGLQSWSAFPCPTWQWTPAPGVTFEKRVWMAHGQNTIYVAYRLLELPAACTARLSLVPLLAWRDYHSEMAACDFQPPTDWFRLDASQRDGSSLLATLRLALPPIQRVTTAPTTLELTLCTENGDPFPAPAFDTNPDWYRRFQHPREQERGLDYQEDLYTPGTLSVPLVIGQTLVMIASTESLPLKPQAAWTALLQRQSGLLNLLNGAVSNIASEVGSTVSDTDVFGQQLALAADQFIVQVPNVRTTVIAGYPWFCDWGRDTMIALPGLCLTTGRPEIAREILLSFAAHVDKGMLPNRFPDVGDVPEYNTVDATLWYFAAIYRYVEVTGDVELLRQSLWGVLQGIIQFHQQGTRYNIHVDPDDHLLYAGQSGVQLTWMDAKVGDWVVTPRIGKPVEINALWYNALCIMAHFAGLLNESSADAYTQEAEQMQAGFTRRFARSDNQGLYDVLDTPAEGAPDSAIRPNQVFALSLPFAVVEPTSTLASSIIDVVRKELLTPCGLRTLSPLDPAFQPCYEGDTLHRDGAYHQGTVWPWLLGPFAEAYAKVTQDRKGARAMLSALQPQMTTFGIGSLAEIFDATAPQRPNGCYAQAWSVAETLRVWKILSQSN